MSFDIVDKPSIASVRGIYFKNLANNIQQLIFLSDVEYQGFTSNKIENLICLCYILLY